MKNVIKFYEFSEKLKSAKIYDNIGAFTVTLFLPVIICFGMLTLFVKFFGDNFIPSDIKKFLLFAAFFFGLIWLIRYKTSLKGVFLYDEYLQIERHSISNLYYGFKINPKIKYDEIKSCTLCPRKSINYEERNDKQLHYLGGSGDNYIRLETINDKVYCFCIENSEDFIDNIEKMLNVS